MRLWQFRCILVQMDSKKSQQSLFLVPAKKVWEPLTWWCNYFKLWVDKSSLFYWRKQNFSTTVRIRMSLWPERHTLLKQFYWKWWKIYIPHYVYVLIVQMKSIQGVSKVPTFWSYTLFFLLFKQHCSTMRNHWEEF